LLGQRPNRELAQQLQNERIFGERSATQEAIKATALEYIEVFFNCTRLHSTLGLIKKVAHTYKYFFTKLWRRVVTTALVIREYFVQPSLVRNAL
jgi:hypothetical protein